MTLTPERKIKTKVSKLLKERGAYHFYPVASMYGSAGIPDIIACYQGKFIGIECKAGRNAVTALQEHNLDLITRAGGISLVVRDDLTELIAVLDRLNTDPEA